MKKIPVWIILAIALWGGNVMAIEEAAYSVVMKDESFEVRKYEPYIIAETLVNGDMEGAGNKAFNLLFKYISGNNTTQQEVAMTAPVGQTPASKKIDMTSPVGQQRVGEQWAVSFMMPSSFTMATLPQPNDPQVRLRQVPAHYSAAIRYSGRWTQESYLKHLEKLSAWVLAQDLNIVGEPMWARYDAPFMPWFLRRNEVLVPVQQP